MNLRCVGILLLVFSILAGCDGYTSAGGIVVNGDGTPVPGATVKLFQGKTQVGIDETSDPDGTFHVAGTHAPGRSPIEMRVGKEGYREDRRRLPANESQKSMRIVLERDASGEKLP